VARTTRVVLWWSGGRLVWAAMALSAGMRDWLTNFSGSSEVFAVTLVAVFTLTELVPFSIALEPDFLPILAVAEGLEATDLIDGMALLPETGVHKLGNNGYEEVSWRYHPCPGRKGFTMLTRGGLASFRRKQIAADRFAAGRRGEAGCPMPSPTRLWDPCWALASVGAIVISPLGGMILRSWHTGRWTCVQSRRNWDRPRRAR